MIKIQAFKWPPKACFVHNKKLLRYKYETSYYYYYYYYNHSAYLLQLTFVSIKSKKAHFKTPKSLIIPLKKKTVIVCTQYNVQC